MSDQEVSIDVEELKRQIEYLNNSIEQLKPYTSSFMSNTIYILEQLNSDFISSIKDVIKYLGYEQINHIIEGFEAIRNQTQIIVEEFEKTDCQMGQLIQDTM